MVNLNKKLSFGLDFGTTNSALSVSDGKHSYVIEIDKNALDPRVIRSMLYFDRRELHFDQKMSRARKAANVFNAGEITYIGEQQFLIGQQAVEKYLEDNKNRTPGTKRLIKTGRLIDTRTLAEVEGGSFAVEEHYEEIDYGTGRLLQALKSALKTIFKGTTIFGKYYTVEELISIYVGHVKAKAEYALGQTIDQITVGRPVYFSEVQTTDQKAQDRLEQAIKQAGFKTVKFQFEPVAAALQYISKLDQSDQVVLVFDFGGGTLDTALVKTGDKPQILATDGVYIGGDLLNADIMQHKLWNYFGATSVHGEHRLPMPVHIYEGLGSWFSIPALNNPDMMHMLEERLMYKSSDPEALKRLIHLIKTNLGFPLYEAIERAKKELSSKEESRIQFSDGPIQLDMPITRTEFESIIQKRVEAVREVVIRTLEKANLQPDQVDKVVRTGGSSLIPVYENMLIDIFGKEKISLFETFTSIAAGLAL